MKMNGFDIIGGEFEIDIPTRMKKAEIKDQGFFYSSGRAALFNILEYLKSQMGRTRILLPDYLCVSIIGVAEKLAFEVCFYKMKEDLSIDYEALCDLYDTKTVVLFINYFGLSDTISIVKELRGIDEEMCIIQDSVQAYFDMSECSDADFVFTSFRKTLPVPDGGWVRTCCSDLPVFHDSNKFSQYKLAGGILKSLRKCGYMDDSVYLDLLEKGENMIDQDYRKGVNVITGALYSRIDLGFVRERRRQNAKFLLEHLREMEVQTVLPVPDTAIPLFIPIRLKNRDKIRESMFQTNIFCPIHWPAPLNYKLERGMELMYSELSLIVDQRYGLHDMQRIVNVLQRFV